MPLLTSFLAIAALSNPPVARPRFVILAVGMKNYANTDKTGFGPLNGPNDVNAFVGALKAYYGLNEAKGDLVRKLVSSQETTREGIWNGLKWLASTAKKGDAVVFFYSGHGTQVPDGSKASGYSQAIVPIDVKRTNSRYDGPIDRSTVIAGPDFRKALTEMQTNGLDNVTMIFDSCHSENISRGSLRAKAGYPNSAPPAKPSPTADKSAGWSIQSALAVISAAQADREAYEDVATNQGVLTTALVQVMKKFADQGSGSVSYDTFMNQVRSRVQYHASVLNQVQVPQFEGKASRALFGTDTIEQIPYYKVSAAKDAVTLEAGIVHGVKDGFLFGLYKSESMEGKPDFLARVRKPIDVSSAGLDIVDEDGKKVNVDPKNLIAVRAKLINGQPSGKVKVYVDGNLSADWLEQLYKLPTADRGTPTEYDLRLSPPGGLPKGVLGVAAPADKWLLTNSKGSILASFSGQADETLIGNLKNEIPKEAKRRTVLELAPSGASAVGVEMEAVQIKTKPVGDRDEAATEIITTQGENVGVASLSLATQEDSSRKEFDQRFALRVRVVSKGPAAYAPFLCVLDVTANGQVKQLWPQLTDYENQTADATSKFQIPRDGKWHYLGRDNDLVTTSAMPTSAEISQFACFSVNGDIDGPGVETLKAIATESYQAFDMLFVRDGVRGGQSKGSRNVLGELLDSIAEAAPLPFKTRAGGKSAPPTNWGVTSVQLIVDSATGKKQ